VGGVGHYENFPVASVLCPPALRPAVSAIYRFARTADDLADEGEATAGGRLADLAAYRSDLQAALAGGTGSGRWPGVFGPLALQAAHFRLPPAPLHALLDAFEQDTRNPIYPDRDSLLQYCRRSANPIGRLLLHLYDVRDAQSLAQADDICTALQLINFWQDLSVDIPRRRHYITDDDCARHGVTRAELESGQNSARVRALVRDLCTWAEELMLRGAPLALHLRGRIGWELRLVVQGGLRVLHKIEAADHGSLTLRPQLKPADWLQVVRRALTMSAPDLTTAPGPAD
jgi:squalene synthase HpnC